MTPVVTEVDSRVELPERYHHDWRAPFRAAVNESLAAGSSVLDVGSGRNPAIPVAERPYRTEYVGLDLSATELEAAGRDAYDRAVVADLVHFVPELSGAFDLAVSWQVLEHVSSLEEAVNNIFGYLRPGGRFVAMFSGGRSAFGIANRVLPNSIGHELVGRVMRRKNSDKPVFPAYYDRCHASAIRRTFDGWTEVRITPFFRGATYFTFSPALMRAYLAYENLICRRDAAELATHYLVVAQR